MIIKALKTATARISQKYFLLMIADMEHPIKRERAYCYELYHQLRLVLNDSEMVLTGEPDKKGHPSYSGSEKKPNPDLIFHKPGSNRHNSSVVEVECTPTLAHLKKDLLTLSQMREKGYQELILLLFAVKNVPWQQLASAAMATGVNLSDINVLLHKTPDQEATVECAPPENAA